LSNEVLFSTREFIIVSMDLMKKAPTIKIGEREVVATHPSYIIFEVASTHEGDFKVAKELVYAAKRVGADAVKFQLFEADKVLNPIAKFLKPVHKYFVKTQTPRNWYPKLMKLCDKIGIDFLCTPFDLEAASFLNQVGIKAVKIASGELTNTPLLSHVAAFGKPVILSTGMATMEEIEHAVGILRKNGCNQIALLQSASVYPMPYEDANIAAMTTLRNQFKTAVGYSDNGSAGILVPLVAVAMGASIIEKHVTHQKGRGHLDDTFALTIDEFREMVKRIRGFEQKYAGRFSDALDDLRDEFGKDVDKVIGSSIKEPAKHGIPRRDGTRMQDVDERQWARRGVYPKKNIKKGERITLQNTYLVRPDIGVSVKNLDRVLSMKATENLKAKMPIFIENKSVRRFRKSDIKKFYQREELKQFRKILEKNALLD